MEYINSFEAASFPTLSDPPMAHVSAVIGRHLFLLGGYRLRLENDVRSITAFDKRDVLVYDLLSQTLATVTLSHDLASLGTFPTELLCSSGMASSTDLNRVYLFGGYSLSKLEAGNALYYIEITSDRHHGDEDGKNMALNEQNEAKSVKNEAKSEQNETKGVKNEAKIKNNVAKNEKNKKNNTKNLKLTSNVSKNESLVKKRIKVLDIGSLCDEADKIKARLVFLGGSHDDSEEEEHKKYPSYRDKSSMVYWKKKLIVFGGYGCHFKKSESAEQNAHDFIGNFGDYVVGSGNRGWTNQLLIYSLNDRSWSNPETNGPAPCPRAAHAAAISEDRMFIFGGRLGLRNTTATIRSNQLYHLDLRTMSWSQVTLSDHGLIGRSWTSFTPISNRDFFIVGGFSGENVPLSDANIISLDDTFLQGNVQPKTACFERASWDPFMDEHSWASNNPFNDPLCRMWHSTSLAPDGRIYIFGGCQNNLIFEIEKIQKTVERVRVSPSSLYKLCLWSLIISRSIIPQSLLSSHITHDILNLTL